MSEPWNAYLILSAVVIWLAYEVTKQKRETGNIPDVAHWVTLQSVSLKTTLSPEEIFSRIEKNTVTEKGWKVDAISLQIFRKIISRWPSNKWTRFRDNAFAVVAVIQRPVFQIGIVVLNNNEPHELVFRGKIDHLEGETRVIGAFEKSNKLGVFKWVYLAGAMFGLAIIVPITMLLIRAHDWTLPITIGFVLIGVFLLRRLRGPDLYEVRFKQRVLEFWDRVLSEEPESVAS